MRTVKGFTLGIVGALLCAMPAFAQPAAVAIAADKARAAIAELQAVAAASAAPAATGPRFDALEIETVYTKAYARGTRNQLYIPLPVGVTIIAFGAQSGSLSSAGSDRLFWYSAGPQPTDKLVFARSDRKVELVDVFVTASR